ncbi:MAG TPA: hypothetical protein VM580_02415, partial [Labilithrix sp.]|nr:hypothetical protein [Labilithrix sp.]
MADAPDATARLLANATTRAAAYLAGLDERRVSPTQAEIDALDEFDVPLPAAPCEAAETLALLDRVGSPATVATAGGRYFG